MVMLLCGTGFCISSLFATGDFLQCLIGYLKRPIVVNCPTIFGYDQFIFINLLKTTSSHPIGLCSVNACSMQQRPYQWEPTGRVVARAGGPSGATTGGGDATH